MEGKEVRFGIADSALFATVTTDASCGAVNAMHDSFTPLGGMVPLINIMLGEVVFGGVGSGLYGMIVFVILSVFIAGLMVGRTPEYLGKKIEAYDVKMAMLSVLIFPLVILVFTAISVVAAKFGTFEFRNPGPHGLSEILYAYTSGSREQRIRIRGDQCQHALVQHHDWAGHVIRALFRGDTDAGDRREPGRKKFVPESAGTFPVTTPLFSSLLVFVVLIVGALTFFPALSLGADSGTFADACRKGFLGIYGYSDEKRYAREIPLGPGHCGAGVVVIRW